MAKQQTKEEPKKEVKTIDLKIQPNHFNTILNALAEVPYKFSAPILEDFRKQLAKQEPVK